MYKNRFLLVVAASLTISSTFKSASGLANQKFLMASLGDSITAAFLANTYLVKPEPAKTGAFFNFWVDAGPDVEPVLLDLISNKSNFSWASGEKIESHYVKLKEYFGVQNKGAVVNNLNTAVIGFPSGDLPRQGDEVMAALKKDKYSALKYVTILIGADDICTSSPQIPEINWNQIYVNFWTVFEKFESLKQKDKVRILVSSLPRIPDLGGPAIKNVKTVGGITCADYQNDFAKNCVSLESWGSPQEYDRKMDFVRQTNDFLNKIVDDANKSFKKLNVVFSYSLFDTEILPENLAADCFHPNEVAQGILSQHLWQDQPWFH